MEALERTIVETDGHSQLAIKEEEWESEEGVKKKGEGKEGRGAPRQTHGPQAPPPPTTATGQQSQRGQFRCPGHRNQGEDCPPGGLKTTPQEGEGQGIPELPPPPPRSRSSHHNPSGSRIASEAPVERIGVMKWLDCIQLPVETTRAIYIHDGNSLEYSLVAVALIDHCHRSVLTDHRHRSVLIDRCHHKLQYR